ncbi:uncharacterized protein LOC122871216 isoform X2 [Siniperca chuatsi]|uniref:uncharacterized protein LOC122871216 isoform X2 n=1 Tax=Siniperca chuatsi TaxID=119488 RepID=UPI001CE19030|nr:uncharacterized protein LOC122871216 isoform X2 [Siniperca chuatsi]
MDLRTVVTISALLLVTADVCLSESDPTTLGTNVRDTSFPAEPNSTTSNCSCPSAAPAATAAPNSSPSSAAPALGLLTVKWTRKCEGKVYLMLYHPSNSSLPVCHGSETGVQSLLRNVCENTKGCKGAPRWENSKQQLNGYHITESGAKEQTSCGTLSVHCTVEVLADVQGQLHAYKVVTALLCCVLLVLLLIRFTRPTVKALQKRLSDRRQNRWIGPTQSHSVSYHRGKTAVKNNDGEKRLSYPALERLAVSDSREPSSNRNSDFNF